MAWKDQVLMRWISLLLHDGHPSSTDTTTTAEVNANTGDNRNAHGASQAQQEPPFSTSASFSSVKGVSTVPGGGTGAGSGGGGHDAAYGWAQRLGLAVHEAFCSARIAELFDIIADYPDSAVAIGELKVRGARGGGREIWVGREEREAVLFCGRFRFWKGLAGFVVVLGAVLLRLQLLLLLLLL